MAAVAAGVMGIALTVSGCSGSDDAAHDSSVMASLTSSPLTTPASSAPTQAHNDADVAFAQGMVPHHRQAVEMADMILAKQGVDPRVVSLANAIKAAQDPEIDQMSQWLTEWDIPAMPSATGMPTMPGHDMATTGEGMMTEQDMTALRDAQGVEASKLFLTQMIEHHNGAIVMAQQEIDGGQFPAAVTLARSIVTAQHEEIATMQEILKSL